MHRELCVLVSDALDLRQKLYSRAGMPLREVRTARKRGPYQNAPLRAARVRENAEEKEIRNPLFDSAFDPYFPDVLARRAAVDLGLDRRLVKGLLRINEATEASYERAARGLSGKVLIPFVLAVGAFLANQVPKELFSYLGWHHYTQYRAFAFFALAGTLVCVWGSG